MNDRMIVLELARIEGGHLAALVTQFAELLDESTDSAQRDPGILRLVPDAYSDDAEAAAEFRSLTESDLIGRRQSDASIVLASLAGYLELSDDPDDPALVESVDVRLDADTARAWLRTLAAIRLVLATRLGIDDEDDHDGEDPRFGIYDWLGYRLDGLVRALDAD
ncbi:DUF2017 family protein [Planococcus sp. APC 4015]|nr:DUF2017 family protein [Planococcus sp. APC 4015]